MDEDIRLEIGRVDQKLTAALRDTVPRLRPGYKAVAITIHVESEKVEPVKALPQADGAHEELPKPENPDHVHDQSAPWRGYPSCS